MKVYKEHLEKAVIVARKSGAILLDLIPKNHNLNSEERYKLMAEVDLKVHDCIFNDLNVDFTDYKYVSAYTKNQFFYKDKPLWVIDPVVGLGNFSHGDPHFAISIALMINGVTVAALVYNPVFNELFTAIKNNGAFLNQKRIHVSKTTSLKHALLSTRFPYNIREGKVTNLGLFNHLIMKAESVLNKATATLDLAYVASGQYDGFWALEMNPWDLTAGILLIKEAGGKVTTFTGENHVAESVEILATNGSIHQETLKSIASITTKVKKN
ncbi:inositol monophosphatase family protein [Maribacter antarcticus]|uniref:inositol monophosphatase family protein n=1 Tax=Maribacter antarcticus TaxID=505250 RepID=UPI00047E2AC7|nr:inositol monophosphatase family protein [Maribacter antarcticus]